MNSLRTIVRRIQGRWRLRKEFNPVCLAPWVHSFVHTSGERRPCCVSANREREAAESGAAFWNGKFMRRLRRKLLAGRLPESCYACSSPVGQYHRFFEHEFAGLKPDLAAATDWRGRVSMGPLSFDHRTTNLCNFKCHMCSSEYSSSFAREKTQLRGDYSLPAWLREPRLGQVKAFHSAHSEKELWTAIEERRVRDIYWAGGEPLLNEFHWRAMNRILELGLASQVNLRYTTNFSTLTFRGQHLFRDLLAHFPRFQISASLDATGPIGEYLREGLQWEKWQEHLQETIPYLNPPAKTFEATVTLTTLGLIDLKNTLLVSQNFGVPLYAQLVDCRENDQRAEPWSPLVFPRKLLDRLLEETWREVHPFRSPRTEMVFRNLEQLAELPAQGDEMSPERQSALRKSLRLLDEKEKLRASGTLLGFLSAKPYLAEWLAQFQSGETT